MFLSWIFLVLIIAVLVILGIVLWAKFFGIHDLAAHPGTAHSSGDSADAAHQETESQIASANRRAVAHGQLAAVEFSVVPRGYRADQVDAVLAECQAEIDRLRAQQDPHAQRPQDTER